jgi:hypothetical protein
MERDISATAELEGKIIFYEYGIINPNKCRKDQKKNANC